MSVFVALWIIVFLLTIIVELPRDGYQYNYASSDGVKKVLDMDGSRNFFSPSRKLNRRSIRSAPDDVGGRTGVWSLVPTLVACTDPSLAEKVAA